MSPAFEEHADVDEHTVKLIEKVAALIERVNNVVERIEKIEEQQADTANKVELLYQNRAAVIGWGVGAGLLGSGAFKLFSLFW